MKTPPVVLFYDHVAKLSGGEIFLWHLLTHLDRDRFLPVVVLGEDGPLREKLCEAGIETHVLPLPTSVKGAKKDELGKRGLLKKLGAALGIVPYIWRLHGLIRRSRAEIVHTNSLKADILGGLAGVLARRPVVWHVHDCIDRNYLPGAAVRFFLALARRLPRHIISVSQAVEDTLLLPPSFPASVVHNGIPWQEPQRASLQKASSQTRRLGPVIGMVGRIARWKGQHIFLDAAAQVRRKFPEARFQIVGGALFGEDAYWDEIHRQAERLGLTNCVEFTGFRSDISALVSDFDVFVHASIAPEPFGIVIIEAMMEEKPVVATRGGGVPEIVVEGETGILVPMNDATALANAIESLLDDAALCERMGRAGRERVRRHFLIGKCAREVEKVYDAVLGAPRSHQYPQ